MKKLMFAVIFLAAWQTVAVAQRPAAGQVKIQNDLVIKIVKAEDARNFAALESLLGSNSESIRERAILAAGRIGDKRAVPILAKKLADDLTDIRAIAAFAIGEIESIDGADAILTVLRAKETPAAVRAAAVEAAGKIAAANPKDALAKTLGEAILENLEAENEKGATQDRSVVLAGITALLRAKPDGGEVAAAKFLTNPDSRIRADAANSLARLRAKNANLALQKMLNGDRDGVARANAARALGAAEDKEAFEILLQSAVNDSDSRVRVSAIRSLAGLKDAKAAAKLIESAERLLLEASNSKKGRPNAQSEFVEIASALGRLLPNTRDARAIAVLRGYSKIDDAFSSEVNVALLRIGAERNENPNPELSNWHQYVTLAHLIGEFATLAPTSDELIKKKAEAPTVFHPLAEAFAKSNAKTDGAAMLAAPEMLRNYARFKTPELADILRLALVNEDGFIRAAGAQLMSDIPASKENTDALKKAFAVALVRDKFDNDAQLAALDALYKIDKKESVGSALLALNARDYLVRKKAFEILADKDLQKGFPGIAAGVDVAKKAHKDLVLPYSPIFGTKLGQILNSDADYRRALSRKNGSVKAVLTTEKGAFTIDFFPEEAPLTVDNFVKLARSGYFNGLEVHRVVPNFVMQDGDPRGDGNGGPGWSIRCEVNTIPYDRGAVGMALSGKDTGGSQWFVTHAPQPHLDGGYTVFGHVNEIGMKVVDNIVRGDKIVSVKIVETRVPQNGSNKKK